VTYTVSLPATASALAEPIDHSYQHSTAADIDQGRNYKYLSSPPSAKQP
jgi:hypothetical protein